MDRLPIAPLTGHTEHCVHRWVESGCAYLTGPAEAPGLGPPAPLVGALDLLAARLADASAELGTTVTIDPLAVLTARAAIAGTSRGGRTNCGGSTRLLQCADGWAAIAFPRDDDIALVPALIQGEVSDDPWCAVGAWCRARRSTAIVERGVLLGLAVAALPTGVVGSGDLASPARSVEGPTPTRVALQDLVVVDLSALWSGPLCGALLAAAGCTVIKVESASRPDGARFGPRRFFDLLNRDKLSVVVDLGCTAGRATLRQLLERADIVIEASRPRALRGLGVDVERLLAAGPRVWASITGHGYNWPRAERIGFGDDAAVAGGLVVHDGHGPSFCADAIADPLTGVVAAAAVLDALRRGGRWHLDLAMSRVAAQVAGPTLPLPSGVAPPPPASPAETAPAPDLGVDTERVVASL